MSRIYSSNQLIKLGHIIGLVNKPQLNHDVYQRIKSFNILRHGCITHRGSKGGINLQRRIKPFISDYRDISVGQSGVNSDNVVDIQFAFKVQVSQRTCVFNHNDLSKTQVVNKDNLHYIKCKHQFSYMDKVQLCYFNAQSAGGKSLSISDYICDKKIDFCCMTESWLKEGDVVTETELTPNGY